MARQEQLENLDVSPDNKFMRDNVFTLYILPKTLSPLSPQRNRNNEVVSYASKTLQFEEIRPRKLQMEFYLVFTYKLFNVSQQMKQSVLQSFFNKICWQRRILQIRKSNIFLRLSDISLVRLLQHTEKCKTIYKTCWNSDDELLFLKVNHFQTVLSLNSDNISIKIIRLYIMEGLKFGRCIQISIYSQQIF